MKIRKQIYLTDTNYFCNRSFTLSYSMITKSWISFHSYLPNFYIAENGFFYSGLNDCCSDFDFIVGIPLAESGCILEGTAITLIPPQPKCSLEGTVRILPNCDELDGTAVIITDCTLDGTAVEQPCVRPRGLTQYSFITGYSSVDSTGSREDACDNLAFISGITDEDDYLNIDYLPVEAFDLIVGNTVYSGWGLDECDCIPDGWYFTQESVAYSTVYHVENCIITEVVDCNATTTTTTTGLYSCALDGTALIVQFPDTCDFNGGTAYII